MAGSDYAALSVLVNFAPGETFRTVQVGIINDNVVEPHETANLTLSSPTGALLGPQSTAVLFIAIVPPGGVVQARYLCRRLRRRFPRLRIVVGFWGKTRRFDRLLARLRSAGASYVTTSIEQTRRQIQSLIDVGPAAGQIDRAADPAVAKFK